MFRKLTLLASVVLLLAGTFFGIFELRDKFQREQGDVRGTVLWIATEVNREYWRLLDALSRFTHGDADITHDDLLLRRDLFWSQLSTYQSGVLGKHLVYLGDDAKTISSLEELLTSTEQAFLELRRGDVEAGNSLRKKLHEFATPLHQMTQRIDKAENQYFVDTFNDTERTLDTLSILVILMALSGTALVILLILETRRANLNYIRSQEAERQVLQANAELESKVQERTAQLRIERDSAQNYLDVAGSILVALDRHGQIEMINRKGCEVFGLPEEKLLGANLIDRFVPPSEHKIAGENFEQIVSGNVGSLEYLESDVLDSGGKKHVIAWHNSLTKDAHGNTTGVLASGEDITQRKMAEEQLADSHARLDEAQILARIGNFTWNLESGKVSWSDNMFRLLKYDPEQDVDIDTINAEIHHPDDLPWVTEWLNEGIAAAKDYLEPREYRVICKDGEVLWIQTRARIETEQGRAVRMFGTVQDISIRRKAEEQLRVSATVFNSTAEGVAITDLDGNILDVNRAFTHITGYERAEVLGRNPRLLKSDRHDRIYYQAMYRSLEETGVWRGEIWNRRKNGIVYPELLTINSIRDDQGEPTGYVAVFADITALKETEERLDYLAHHDPLTDLPNRLLLNERLGQSIIQAKRARSKIAIVFIDLDRFKTINDGLGHTAGDAVISELAIRLKENVRSEDTVARIGGDEFIVILRDVAGTEQTASVVKKLMEAISIPLRIQNNEVRVTASMGISFFPEDGKNAEELLRNADTAMYRAKEDGRNTYQFYLSELTVTAFEHVLLESSLRNALGNREFYLLYQPQYALENREIIGMEVLLRWQHPSLGLISPARFIPVAEQTGLIREFGDWVLRTACAQGRAWLDEGLDIGRIAVNVSRPQIHHTTFVDDVKSAIEDSGLPYSYVALEVTEGFVMYGTDSGVKRLEELRQLGVEVAVDDFGTGYSSLRYLKELPIDKLKIDQSFVSDLPNDRNDAAIASAVISMGRSLGLNVIAEGVETVEQEEFLRQQGCNEAQGFLFSRPVTTEQMGELLASGALTSR